MLDQHYLKLLARDYPTINDAAAEAIRLNAILSLPKGTEFYFSDLHGEHEAFIHLLRSASGFIRTKIDDLFSKSVSTADRIALSNLIYYPEKELEHLDLPGQDRMDWYRVTLFRLLEICNSVSAKYTRYQIRKKLSPQFATILEELLHVDSASKTQFFEAGVKSILETGMMHNFITSLCITIQRLAIDKLHIIGDIFDRGPRADAIMNALIDFHDVDVQWGNHDILWMGAATGSLACVANVVRLGISYNNFDLLEDGYNINLRSLSVFASEIYRDDPCTIFRPHILDENKYDPVDVDLAAKMHKAIAIIQFKLEGQLISRHPEYEMDDRRLLECIDFANGSIRAGDKDYPLLDSVFPTIDPADPLALNSAETELIRTIATSFRHSEKLQNHIHFLYLQGNMYKRINGKLLYHGCIPMTKTGAFEAVHLDGKTLSGKAYLDAVDSVVRKAYFSPPHTPAQHHARDFLWYLWCGPKSPLFGKDKMATFERYFVEDKAIRKETMNPYYQHLDDRVVCEKILRDFEMDPAGAHIVNGHVPVKLKAGESPIKGGGLLFVIDGGISKAYQKQTGIGGYTLVYNSRYLALAEHSPYHVDEDQRPIDFSPKLQIVETMPRRVTVGDTDEGAEIRAEIDDLLALVQAYRTGLLRERV